MRRIAITGGRADGDRSLVYRTLSDEFRSCGPFVLVNGVCPPQGRKSPGVDWLGLEWYDEFGREFGCLFDPHPARWDLHNRAAGPKRNAKMVKSGIEKVFVFPGGAGTQNMRTACEAAGILLVEVG